MGLPQKYSWLTNEQGPVMILKAIELYDTIETPGVESNPVIISWAKEIDRKVEDIYRSDEIPWCGLFIAVVAKRSYKQVAKDPLWALNWGTFGKYTDTAMLGDVLVFVRKTNDGRTAGHVGLYIGEDDDCYHVLGGNQLDKVCITRIAKNRLYASRRPNYNIQPGNVRVIKLSNDGIISGNEQ